MFTNSQIEAMQQISVHSSSLPQSHSSPPSMMPLPHCGSLTGGPGILKRQKSSPSLMSTLRSSTLQLLNIVGGGFAITADIMQEGSGQEQILPASKIKHSSIYYYILSFKPLLVNILYIAKMAEFHMHA